MLISPEMLINDLKNAPLERLYKERNSIIQALKQYDLKMMQNLNEEDLDIKCPSDEAIYKNNQECLDLLENLIIKRQMEDEKALKLEIDDFTNLYFKIERSNTNKKDPFDRWCDITIGIFSEYFNYFNFGELLLEGEVLTLKTKMKELVEGNINKNELVGFIEPDLEFYFQKNLMMDMKINLFEKGALSANHFSLCLDKKEVKQIYEYINMVFGVTKAKVEKTNNVVPTDMDGKYYYVSVKYDDYNYEKSYCYISENTEIKIGDKVIVDRAGYNTIATVVDTNFYDEENVPYPINRTKKVIELVNENTDLSKYDMIEDEDYYDEEERDEFVLKSELEEQKKKVEKLKKIILNTFYSKISIKELMRYIEIQDIKEAYVLLFYNKKLNLFVNRVADDYYIMPEYSSLLLNKKDLREIVKDSIPVPKKLYEKGKEEVYEDAIKFCKNNNIDYIDDYNEEEG